MQKLKHKMYISVDKSNKILPATIVVIIGNWLIILCCFPYIATKNLVSQICLIK